MSIKRKDVSKTNLGNIVKIFCVKEIFDNLEYFLKYIEANSKLLLFTIISFIASNPCLANKNDFLSFSNLSLDKLFIFSFVAIK